MVEIAESVNGVPIRISSERWTHIVENHDDLAGYLPDVIMTIEEPDWITRGYRGAFVAWKGFGRGMYLSVVYKELHSYDGFLVTAFFTSKGKKSPKIWP